MNNKGNLIINLFLFLMALGIIVVFISPINTFINMMQQSDNLNCRGYIHNGNAGDVYSFNETLNGGNSGSPIGCLVLNLYLPYILLVVLIMGILSVLGGKTFEWFMGSSPQEGYA